MFLSAQQFLIQAAPLPAVAAGVVGFVRFRQLEPALRALVVLIGLALLTEAVSRVLWAQKIPNLFLLPFYTTAELALLSWVYARTLGPSAWRWAAGLAAGFALGSLGFYAGSSWAAADGTRFNSGQRFAESLCVLGLVLAFFYHRARQARPGPEPMTWVSAGLLVYFAGNALLFLGSNYLLGFSKTLNMTAWAVHAGLYMVLYCLYGVSLWTSPRPK